MPITPENPIDFMIRHQMIVTDMLDAGNELHQKWEEQFANHLSDRVKLDILLHSKKNKFGGVKKSGYLWHLFSSGKRDCLEKKLAREAFDRVAKDTLYLFFQDAAHGIKIEHASRLTEKSLRAFVDAMYIVDSQFTWTYVQTSEFKVGPFFCHK